MDVVLTRTTVEVKLSPLEKVGALRRDLSIPRHRIAEASVDPTPMRSIRGRFTFGLRAPGFIFVCSSDRGRHFWAIRRDLPAVHLKLRRGDSGPRRLERVTVSTPDAEALVAELTQSARTAPGAETPASAPAR